PEQVMPHAQRIEQASTVERAAQRSADQVVPSQPAVVEPRAMRPDVAQAQPAGPTSGQAPPPTPAIPAADTVQPRLTAIQPPAPQLTPAIQRAATPAPVAPEEDRALTPPTVTNPATQPVDLALAPVVTEGATVALPTEAAMRAPEATEITGAHDATASVPSVDRGIADQPDAPVAVEFHEVRQARRRPMLPARPPSEDQTTAITPENEAASEASRAQAIDRLARLARAYGVAEPAQLETPGPLEAATVPPPSDEPPSDALAPAATVPIPPETTELAAPTPLPVPLTIPDATRRFLRPLLGFDPHAVPVYRDAATDRLTAGNNADAVTDGTAVVVASTQAAIGRPETVGLLAHELTHVARRQRPRFVPPIARTAAQPARPSPGDSERVASLTEESLAERVEERVIQAARAVPRDPVRLPPSVPSLPTAVRTHRENATQPEQRAGQGAQWGDLPAPWEAVPDWMQQPPTDLTAPANAAPGQSADTATRAPVLQRAAEGRSLSDHHADHPPSYAQFDDARGPEPDLDALARQVYAILKDRLSVERRRTG
ncbi:MAG: DUF4157 domain-containing protein, partial [Thermomicrobia bacterium]|nr:DUF4157 domain-containing protein [Thermomicrobia bacterium]